MSDAAVSQQPTPLSLTLDVQHMLSLYEQGKHEELSYALLEILYAFQHSLGGKAEAAHYSFFERYVKVLFTVFSKPDYQITDKYAVGFISKSMVLSNMVAVTPFKTTDVVLQEVVKHPNNAVKVLTLYSHRNQIDFDMEVFFKGNALLASYWWSVAVTFGRKSQITEHHYEKLRSFLRPEVLAEHWVPPLKPDGTFIETSFLATPAYTAPEQDVAVKKAVSDAIVKASRYTITPLPAEQIDFGQVAVISHTFRKGHATYKALAPLLYSLKGHYRLTLVSLLEIAELEDKQDRELFDEVLYLTGQEKQVLPTSAQLQGLLDKGIGTFIYTDVGQEMSAVVMANHRLAPIQITCYGNPVTTQARHMDYFIVSEEVEKAEVAEANYSERLVYIPGLAATPVIADYTPPEEKKDDAVVHIACSWGNGKTNYPHLGLLKRIYEKSAQKVHFHLIGMDDRNLLDVVCEQELAEVLPEGSFTFVTRCDYEEYMGHFARCHLAIDSTPFGGYNRVIDAFLCRIPMVVLPGEYAPSRFGAALMRRLGLEELIAENAEAFVEIVVRLAEDKAARAALGEAITGLDLQKLLVDTGEAGYFKEAIDYVIQEREALAAEDSHAPIYIGKG